jgi:hypothetical protein
MLDGPPGTHEAAQVSRIVEPVNAGAVVNGRMNESAIWKSGAAVLTIVVEKEQYVARFWIAYRHEQLLEFCSDELRDQAFARSSKVTQ